MIEVLEQLKLSSGIDFDYQIAERRAGDPPRLVAKVERIQQVLGFTAKNGLKEIVDSAWAAS